MAVQLDIARIPYLDQVRATAMKNASPRAWATCWTGGAKPRAACPGRRASLPTWSCTPPAPAEGDLRGEKADLEAHERWVTWVRLPSGSLDAQGAAASATFSSALSFRAGIVSSYHAREERGRVKTMATDGAVPHRPCFAFAPVVAAAGLRPHAHYPPRYHQQ